MNPRYEAREAYRAGEGQDANPYHKGSHEWAQWALEMQQCQHEELNELMGWNYVNV